MEFRCPSCNTVLGDGLSKCPSCGLPLKPQAAQTRSRALFAGLMLFSLFAIGTLQAGLTIADPDAVIRPASYFGVGSYGVEGLVHDANGTAAPGVRVLLGTGGNASRERNATTGPDGTYRFEDVPIGVYVVNATLDNRTAIVRAMVNKDASINLTLPASVAVARSDHASMEFVRVWLQVCGGFLFALCLLTLLGTIACYRRRNWGLAMAGAISGAFLWLPLSILLSLVTIVVLAKGRSDFR